MARFNDAVRMRTGLVLGALVAVIGTARCDDDGAMETKARGPSKARTNAGAEKDGTAPAEEQEPEYVYSPVGKRDPFKSHLDDPATQTTTDPARKLQSTEEFELNQYRLTGLVTGTSQPRAMVEDPRGRGHTLRIGSRLGKRGGQVTRISTTGITVMEQFQDPASGEQVQVPVQVPLPQRPELDIVVR